MGLIKFSFEGIRQMKEIFHTAVENGELLGKSVGSFHLTDLLQAIGILGVTILRKYELFYN